MNSHVPGHLLKVSKISPYSTLEPSDSERAQKVESVGIFYENGGHAVTIGNTRPVQTSANPRSKDFARPVAGESGRPLFPYMIRLVKDIHKKYPDLPIIACGGIFDSADAWQAIENGATLVELYTALTFHGFGIVREIQEGLRKKLGSQSLQDFIDSHRRT